MNQNREEALFVKPWFIESPRIWAAPSFAEFVAETKHGQPTPELR